MTTDHESALDLDAYLARIGWTGERLPTVEVLRSVHRAHALGIPFENLEPVLGSAPRSRSRICRRSSYAASAAVTATSRTPCSPPH